MATSIPPHNVAEICDALLHMTKPLKKGNRPQPTFEKLVEFIPGPDFPTGGVLCENRADVIAAYRTGRGGFRIRAKWETEHLKGGAFRIIITEMPYQVQKSKLIEKIAELLYNRKLTMLDDIRDESTDQVRLVLDPKTRNVDPAVLMESLFRQTDFETRFSFNMNVLDHGRVPRVMNLREVLQAYLDHRHDVLVRRKNFRLGKIEHRLEILDGYLVAYLNIDEVILIIREEDDAKAEFNKSVQAERCASRRNSQYAAAPFAEARGDGNPRRTRSVDRGAQGDQSAPQECKRALAGDRGRDKGTPKEFCARHRAWPTTHGDCRCALCRRHPARSNGGARAGHCRLLDERLGSRH